MSLFAELSTIGTPGNGQFKAQVQVPFQAAFPQQMGVGGPLSMSVNGANIHQMDQHMARNFEKWMELTMSQTQSMVAGKIGGNSNPQAAQSSSSRSFEGSDSMSSGMANLSLTDAQPQIPTHFSPPTSFSSDPQIGLKLIDQTGSSNPSTSNLSPCNNNAVQHFNPSLAPNTDMVNFPSVPTAPYGNNPFRPPPPSSTSPTNFLSSSSGGPDFNIYHGNLTKHDHGVYHTSIDSFNERNNTLQNSFNDNSLVDFTGNCSGMFHSMICLS
jgi:hypothetical protein